MIQPLHSPNQLVYLASQNQGQCIILQIHPIQFSKLRFVIYVILSICLAGFPFLIVFWYPWLKKKIYYSFSSLQDSTDFFIKNYDSEYTYAQKIKEIYYPTQNEGTEVISFISFTNRYMKYIIQGNVVRAVNFNFNQKIRSLMKKNQVKGLNQIQAKNLRQTYGPGTMIIQRPNILVLFFREVFRPLYLFILFSVILWSTNEYYYYAGVIFLTSAVAIVINLIQIKQLNQKIFHMAYYDIPINVLRQDKVINMSSVDVVPGDIVFLKDPIKIPFQAIILQGSALINQCALTGQSVPIVKKADIFQSYTDQSHSIDKAAFVYQGTTIIQVNSKKKMQKFQALRQAYGIPVCVIRTNFITLKGQLIRIISFPKQQQNIFQKQSTKFLIVLFLLALATFVALVIKLHSIVQVKDLILKFLDLITITVPPGLPVSMTFGIIFAVQKLKNKQIFCISPNKVISGGRVNFACFDKTGTLTEDFMDFYGLVPAHSKKFQPFIQALASQQKAQKVQHLIKQKPYISAALANMASNHSIIQLQNTGQLIGDPMQIKLFQFGQFQLDLSANDPDVVFSFTSKRHHNGTVYKRFQFDSDVQRMSVICKNSAENNETYLYCKGSPEIMLQIMNSSTVPENYNQILKNYASHGFRVLAIASRKMTSDIKTVSRKDSQTNLNFDGFQVFENKLKPQTYDAIQQLKDSNIPCVMITGDNALTGSNISFKCEIADIKKKMIICDYRNDKFVTEDFIFTQNNKQKRKAYLNKKYGDKQVLNQSNELNEEKQNSYQINLKTQSSELSVKADASKIKPNASKPNQNLGINTQDKLSKNSENMQEFLSKMIKRAKEQNAQFCLTGSAFAELFNGHLSQVDELRKEFIDHVTVYARAKPNDKAKVVSLYQHFKKIVVMCGDGANDCGALKQADVGLSLSQAQASISAPFTSKVINISAVVQLLKQCRAGLATNFSLFNIMALYSLIQYSTTVICQFYYAYPSDLQFLYWDIFCNFFFFLTIGYTATVQKLNKHIPNCSLFSVTNLFQVLFMFGIQLLGQICMILALSGAFEQQTDYYTNGGFTRNQQLYKEQLDFIQDTPESNIMFLFSNFMYIFSLVAFSISKPWRKLFYTNKPFMVVLIFVFVYSVLIVMVPKTRIPDFYIQWMIYDNVNGFILGMSLLFGIFMYVMQKFVWQPLSQKLRELYPEKQYL